MGADGVFQAAAAVSVILTECLLCTRHCSK